jgi:YVTN family beta-propeller protein
MTRAYCVAIALTGVSLIPTRAAVSPFAFVSAIELPRVEGRIDHLAFDDAANRLYVAALGNNTVEVLDTATLRHLSSVSGFAEPQGIAVLTDRRRVAVANRKSGRIQFLNAENQQLGPSLHPGDDADNVRYDATAHRVYVGYGEGAIAVIDPDTPRLLGQTALGGHPESLQLERTGARIFVNVPTVNQVAVIDRTSMTVVATWPVTAATANFPMALDETNHRLFIGCRRPAVVLVLDTTTGRQLTSFDVVGDTDDLFYDAARKRLYVSGGDGFLDAIAEQAPNSFVRVEHLPTAAGARTSLFTPDQSRVYVAVPHRDRQRAEIRVYDVR